MLTKSDLSEIQKIVSKELKPVKKAITEIRKDMKTIVTFFDHAYLELRAGVEKIEEHLGITPG